MIGYESLSLRLLVYERLPFRLTKERLARLMRWVPRKRWHRLLALPLLMVMAAPVLLELLYMAACTHDRAWKLPKDYPRYGGYVLVHCEKAFVYAARDDCGCWRAHDGTLLERVYEWREFEGSRAEPWHAAADYSSEKSPFAGD